jgi:hypothetical protein
VITLLVTMSFFPLIGWATSRALRLRPQGTRFGQLATYYIFGLAANGITLNLLALLHVPIGRVTVIIVPVASVIIAALTRPVDIAPPTTPHPRLATVMLALPCIVFVGAAAVLPMRDYDGRVTWLPKAVAIATSGSIDGAFFHGAQGLNLHNHYPLLLPLNDAAIMLLCGGTIENVRWLYAFISISALFAARDALSTLYGAAGAWSIAAVAWSPVLTNIEGGALAAYNDCAIAAFTGLAVLYAMFNPPAARVLGLLLAALVLTKNEGSIIALVIVLALFAVRRTAYPWLPVLAPVVGAVIILALWRARVPPAYDEQYTALLTELPARWQRAPAAFAAFAAHALDPTAWGYFWPATILALTITIMRCRTRVMVPATTLILLLAADTMAFTITSWNIGELATVAANRLLLHAMLPACTIIAAAVNAVNGTPETVSTR